MSSRNFDFGRNGMFKYRRFLASLFLTISMIVNVNSIVFAQADATALSGTVSDQSGSAVAGAKVELQSPATGLRRNAITSADGIYQFPALPVGDYRINISKGGFRPVEILSIRLEVG